MHFRFPMRSFLQIPSSVRLMQASISRCCEAKRPLLTSAHDLEGQPESFHMWAQAFMVNTMEPAGSLADTSQWEFLCSIKVKDT